MRVLMLFLDGVGIGTADPKTNPFFAATLPSLRSLFSGEIPTVENPILQSQRATLLPLDANMGVDGLPQSGTGQTALFTGLNASKIIGKHFGPYPYSSLRPLIREKNIFRQLKDSGKSVYFANAYPQKFFDYFKDRQTRLTVTTLSCGSCDMPLHQAPDLAEGNALSADITNAGWPKMGYPDILPIEPAEAGRRLVRLSSDHDFVLFEYWNTDKAGHSEDMAAAVKSIELFDAMLGGILDSIDTTEALVFITSDHGNMEDMSTKVHTRNPVPAILVGHRHAEVAHALLQQPDLTNVTPTLVKFIAERIPVPV